MTYHCLFCGGSYLRVWPERFFEPFFKAKQIILNAKIDHIKNCPNIPENYKTPYKIKIEITHGESKT